MDSISVLFIESLLKAQLRAVISGVVIYHSIFLFLFSKLAISGFNPATNRLYRAVDVRA